MRLLSLLLSSILFVPASFAHTDGLSFERQEGDILIDIGFGKEMPSVGSTLTYSFDLFNVADPNAYQFEPFTQVHVRILKDRRELLEKTLPNDSENVPFLAFPFTEEGDYSMTVVYDRKDKPSIDTTFGFRVNAAQTQDTTVATGAEDEPNLLVTTIVALAILLIVARFLLLLRRKD